MILLSFKAEHARSIQLQQMQSLVRSEVKPEELEKTEAITGMVGDEVIFCFGRVRQWEGRWVVWAMLSNKANRHMVSITRAAKRALLVCSGRVELVVQHEFQEAHRWAHMLGFQWHHFEERFLPDEGDADIYVRYC